MKRREPVDESVREMPERLKWENRPDLESPEVRQAWNDERLRWYEDHGIDLLDELRAQSQPREIA